MSKENNRLRSFFNEELDRWREEKKEEHWLLIMKLLNWVCQPVVSIEDEKFWNIFEGQILVKAEKLGISQEKVIEYLFSQKTAKEWMSEFE